MVKIITGIGKSGLQEWFLQRVTAVFLVVYLISLLVYSGWCTDFSFAEWQKIFANPIVKYSTLLAIISLNIHVWIGMWTVTTDYLNIKYLRILVQLGIFASLLYYLLWTIEILWGT